MNPFLDKHVEMEKERVIQNKLMSEKAFAKSTKRDAIEDPWNPVMTSKKKSTKKVKKKTALGDHGERDMSGSRKVMIGVEG